MCGLLSTPVLIIVHGRQVIMHQRVGVYHLDCRHKWLNHCTASAKHMVSLFHEDRAKPLSTGSHTIVHGLKNNPLLSLLNGKKLLKHVIYMLYLCCSSSMNCDLFKFPFKLIRIPPVVRRCLAQAWPFPCPVPYHWHSLPHQAPSCRAQRPHPGIHPHPPSSPLSALSVQSAPRVSVFFIFFAHR